MSTKKYFIGVDGGSTKTEAVLIDENKKEMGRGLTAGSNADIFGLSESVDRVFAAIEQACAGKNSNITGACLAIAGIDTKKGKSIWEQAIKNHYSFSKYLNKKPFVVNDSLAALRSGTTAENAIVIIAGTGSNCFGRNEKGEEAKSGGVDYILSDEGSGYNIGLRILKRITQSIDGRNDKTILKDLLFRKLNISSFSKLVSQVYEKPWNKADIASIAPLAEKAAEKEDKVAKEIIERAAHDLGIMIKAVANKLQLKNKQYEIVTAGSVFNIQTILMIHLKKDIKQFSPKAILVKPHIDSATAAAYLAMEQTQ
ncbi:hypothetical protein A3D04_01690 [Candidatus Curtissbacteria bacterium RIFCSPHIGHO2_02_FULL_40_16b]|uniref:ATPase BadF/BadG/BcrA/BcrD type domain-containing protein n=1 Tax=Candidatus Curtissbacteria bacterium RIFCSPHIGHO2_02_FULL_40_16b TaxID=1797714 RepID=A0A1F5G8H0_9BACT|nr:MAG: hypothetical protein A3D04_01690 [Candidatus Curtissbacteria bacterium RIFCSPHIGHO2_02_FULL_40_16b]